MMKNQWPTIMGRQIAPNPNPESKLLTTINGDYNSVQFNNYGTLANQKNNSLYNRSNGSLVNFGMFNNSGRVFNENLAKINNQSITKNTGEAYNDGTINNSGEFINGNRFTVGEGLVANNGDFNIFGLLINYGKISNTGNIYLSPGFSSNALQASCRFFNYSVTDTTNGIIDNSKNPNGASGFINMRTGTIIGKSHIKGPWTDHGKISPGNSTGGMFFEGNYYKRGGSHTIELAGEYDGNGDRASTQHDWIEVSGDVELAGQLEVNLINNFKLSLDHSFVILKVDGDLTGEYDQLTEGSLIGHYKSENGAKISLFITYRGGDGNDIELYTQSLPGVLPESLSDPRIIGSNADDSLTGMSANEVIFGGSGDDVLRGGAGDDRVTGGNGDDLLCGGVGHDILKGDRGADTYQLSAGNDEIIGFSFAENDQISVNHGADVSLKQVGDNLLITGEYVDNEDLLNRAVGIHTTLLDVDKNEFLAANAIDYI